MTTTSTSTRWQPPRLETARTSRPLSASMARERWMRARLGPGVPVETWDERFSTAAAERQLLEADLSRARRKQVIDAAAAAFILQGWLDARRVPS